MNNDCPPASFFRVLSEKLLIKCHWPNTEGYVSIEYAGKATYEDGLCTFLITDCRETM